MQNEKKIQSLIGAILLFGTILSASIVIIGSTLYLLQNGGHSLQTELLFSDSYRLNAKEIWASALSFSPIGIIALGIMTLVATQILRVAMLACYYAAIRDLWFTLFSFFILLTLVYSSI